MGRPSPSHAGCLLSPQQFHLGPARYGNKPSARPSSCSLAASSCRSTPGGTPPPLLCSPTPDSVYALPPEDQGAGAAAAAPAVQNSNFYHSAVGESFQVDREAMAAADARQEKVRKYEEFVDRRLKPDLANAIAQRDKVFRQQKTFADLKRNIENLEKNGVTSMRSMINLGSEVYAQAEVPDTRHIFVDIGLGFHVEFTWQEALQFISVREARLARQIDEYTHLIASIKAQIKLVCEGIRELLQLPPEKELALRNTW